MVAISSKTIGNPNKMAAISFKFSMVWNGLDHSYSYSFGQSFLNKPLEIQTSKCWVQYSSPHCFHQGTLNKGTVYFTIKLWKLISCPKPVFSECLAINKPKLGRNTLIKCGSEYRIWYSDGEKLVRLTNILDFGCLYIQNSLVNV